MMRDKISKNNKYYLDDHRRLELKHFCLQYPNWEREYGELCMLSIPSIDRSVGRVRGNVKSDPVASLAVRKEQLVEQIQLVNRIAIETDEIMSKYILLSVTQGYSYDFFKARLDIPCGRDMFYEFIRRFYWLLDKA